MRDEFASVVEVRKGRYIYLRKVVLDVDGTFTATNQQQSTVLQMIFVHGICGTEQQFQLLLQSIHDQLLLKVVPSSSPETIPLTISCWLYDQIGCGQSPMLHSHDDYSYKETQADLEALLSAEQNAMNAFPAPSSTQRTIVVGHSYGPSVFVPLLSESNLLPNLIGFVLINTSVRCQHLPIADGGHVIMRLPLLILQCLQKQLTEAFIGMAIHPKHTELQHVVRTASQKNNMSVAKAYHRHSKWMTMSQLQQTAGRNAHQPPHQVPILIIHGTSDGVTPIECGQYMYNQLLRADRSHHSADDDDDDVNNDVRATTSSPVTFVMIDEASHMTMIEQPQETARAIVSFIASLMSYNY